MHHFNYRNGRLHAENVSLETIAEKVGTPAYVYSQATLERHFKAFKDAFSEVDSLICFSVKANANKAVLSLFASMGGGVDIVSGGEMQRSLAAGVKASKIVYSGVGKTKEEMRAALAEDILMFNLESAQELQVLNRVAGEMGVKARVSFRVNPDVDAKTHPKITTGLEKNKFGLSVEEAFVQYKAARELPNLEVKGLSCHIGSQLTEVTPFEDTLDRLAILVKKLREEGHTVDFLDIGGGLGITYDKETPPAPNEYAKAITKVVNGLNVKLILEPGRVLTGNAGLLLARVLYTKSTKVKRFVVVDAAMNDLIRPSFYNAYHAVWPVKDQPSDAIIADVVGPICESGDFLAKNREVADFEPGDLLTLMSAGAYCFSMSSNYNSRPRAAEVMVQGERFEVIRARETIEDLTRGESLPSWME